jgi:HD-GYP domain-containing protein (c-di-GMP phosphodiesterase class II)
MQSSQLSEVETENLHSELAAEEQADFSGVAVELALELTHLASDDEEREETAQGLLGVFLRLLDEDIASLVRAAEHLSTLSQSLFSDSTAVQRLRADCVGALSEPEAVTQLLRRIQTDRCLEPAALTAHLEHLGVAALPTIVPWMGRFDRAELRRAVSQAVIAAGDDALKEIEHALPASGESAKAALAREMLYVLGHHSEQSALPLLRKLLAVDDSRIRRETALTLGRYRGRPTFELWLDLLEDHDPDLRGLAISALARGQGSGLARLIFDRLQSSVTFADWSLDDKRRAFRVVARLAGEEALPWFSETLRGAGHLPRPVHSQRLPQGAGHRGAMTEKGAPAAASPEARLFAAQAREVLQELAVLIRNAGIHDLSNEVFREPLQNLEATLGEIFKTERSFRLQAIGREFFANRTRIRMEIRTLHTYKFVWQKLQQRSLGGFQFDTHQAAEDLASFLVVFMRQSSHDEDGAPQFNRALAESGLTGVQALSPLDEEGQQLPEEQVLDRRRRAINAYQQALDFIRETVVELDSPAQVNLRRAKRAVQRLVDLSYEEGDGFSMIGLASIKDHDDYTFNHMVNVCVLAIAFGHRLGLPRPQLADLGLSALYHDLGKLQIPLEVLRSHGPLTDEEWALIGNHTVFGAQALFPTLAENPETLPRILVALQHHYGYDRSGYPDIQILKRQRLHSRIVAICDAFDAMTTKRVYQRRFLPDEALAVIYKAAGGRYDPLLVQAFINCMGIFPPGSTVQLATGELAVVVEPCRNPDKVHQPIVNILVDLDSDDPEAVLVDLGQADQQSRQILYCVDPADFQINSCHYAV